MTRVISFVMPVRDEAQHIQAAIKSVRSQLLPKGWKSELIVALAPSTDATEQLLKAEVRRSPKGWLKLVPNPAADTASGLNLAIARAEGEVIARVDGHSQLPSGYAITGLGHILSNPKIANVGGMMLAVGDQPLQRAIAWAYGSRWGLGGGKFHVGGEQGEADSVYLGIFRADALAKVGGFDSRFVRGQDWELNQRLRDAGYLVWFDPALRVEYRPRNSLKSLGSQFFQTGRWRGIISREARGSIQARYLAPPLLVLASLLLAPAFAYLLAITFISVLAKLDLRSKLRLLVVLPTMHFCWGLGFLLGFLKPASQRA